MAHRFLFCGGIVYYPMPQWNYSALIGAGGVVSTCADLSRWLHGLKQFAVDEPEWAERYFGGGGPGDYAYGWVHEEVQGKKVRFHGGETPGYCAVILSDPSGGLEVILLLNSDFVLLDSVDEFIRSIAAAMQ